MLAVKNYSPFFHLFLRLLFRQNAPPNPIVINENRLL